MKSTKYILLVAFCLRVLLVDERTTVIFFPGGWP